jgi:hypothetical protein
MELSYAMVRSFQWWTLWAVSDTDYMLEHLAGQE